MPSPVRPSVHHTGGSVEDGCSYDYATFTTEYPHDSSFIGNIGSGGTEYERGMKNTQFSANKSPYLKNGAR